MHTKNAFEYCQQMLGRFGDYDNFMVKYYEPTDEIIIWDNYNRKCIPVNEVPNDICHTLFEIMGFDKYNVISWWKMGVV